MWGRVCTDLEDCSLSLGSWNEGVGRDGEESNVRTLTEQARVAWPFRLSYWSSFRFP